MRRLTAKTRDLEETARREAFEQSLRVTQLSILREISRTIIGQLDPNEITTAVTAQLQTALGYDSITIAPDAPQVEAARAATLVACVIRDAEGRLGYLVADNRPSGRGIDPRERELLEMLAEYLAIALRNSRLYGEIAATKHSLEQLIASAGDAIITITPDDRIDGWNPAAERTFGLTARQALKRRIVELLPEGDYARARGKLEGGAEREMFETITAAPGRPRPLTLAVTLSALRNRRQGELDGLIAIVRDITAQREIEDQLHQAEKLTALGRLAGGIAHDFNNLLQAILGYAQLMKQNLANGELIERSLSVVESAAMDGAETVRRIQTFARLRPDEQFVRVDINQIVQDAVAITRPRWEEKIAHESRPLELRLDLQAARVAAGPAGPPHRGPHQPDPERHGRHARRGHAHDRHPAHPGRDVRVTVADTGVGMTESVRQRIFEPFFSTKGEAGSGLGLSMAYSIVRRHGGEIRVDTAPGAGTTFTLIFPVGHRVAASPPARAQPTGTRRLARILVVDDDSQVLSSITRDATRRRPHGDLRRRPAARPSRSISPGASTWSITNIGMAGHERLGGRRATPRDRYARAAALHHGLGTTGRGSRAAGRARRQALPVQAGAARPISTPPCRRRWEPEPSAQARFIGRPQLVLAARPEAPRPRAPWPRRAAARAMLSPTTARADRPSGRA